MSSDDDIYTINTDKINELCKEVDSYDIKISNTNANATNATNAIGGKSKKNKKPLKGGDLDEEKEYIFAIGKIIVSTFRRCPIKTSFFNEFKNSFKWLNNGIDVIKNDDIIVSQIITSSDIVSFENIIYGNYDKYKVVAEAWTTLKENLILSDFLKEKSAEIREKIYNPTYTFIKIDNDIFKPLGSKTEYEKWFLNNKKFIGNEFVNSEKLERELRAALSDKDTNGIIVDALNAVDDFKNINKIDVTIKVDITHNADKKIRKYYTVVIKPKSPQSGGASKTKKLKATTARVMIGKRNAVVYETPRGKKYVKKSGEFVALKDLKKNSK